MRVRCDFQFLDLILRVCYVSWWQRGISLGLPCRSLGPSVGYVKSRSFSECQRDVKCQIPRVCAVVMGACCQHEKERRHRVFWGLLGLDVSHLACWHSTSGTLWHDIWLNRTHSTSSLSVVMHSNPGLNLQHACRVLILHTRRRRRSIWRPARWVSNCCGMQHLNVASPRKANKLRMSFPSRLWHIRWELGLMRAYVGQVAHSNLERHLSFWLVICLFPRFVC